MCYNIDMDTITHRNFLAEIYGLGENELVAMYSKFTPAIRNDAIATLCITEHANHKVASPVVA